MNRKPPHFRNRYLLGVDALALITALLLAYILRFDGAFPDALNTRTAIAFGLTVIPVKLALFVSAGLYRRIWRYASVAELERIVLALTLATAVACIIGVVVLPVLHVVPLRVPLSVLALDSLLSAMGVVAPRLFYRVLFWHEQRRRQTSDGRAIIVGAGAAGHMIAKELLTNPSLGLYPVAFVDDDMRKARHLINEIPVVGSINDIRRIAAQNDVQAIVIAMPSAPGSVIRRVVKAAADCGLKALTLPPLSDILSGRALPAALRDVQIEDLLRREAVETDMAAVRNLARGRTVLITGAGGSIGSELGRQLASIGPSRLVILGHGENSIFDIQSELRSSFPNIPIIPIIADIRDAQRINAIFDDVRPYAVFHAAAHKHVPLMEENVVEAITNNVLGTKNVVKAALTSGAEHLVLISTDKAVRPTSIMGATKRLAERIVQHAATTSGRNFVSVRFGNVLGSRGSVVPTFMKQIRQGGPVTVTHPDMRRYFMTIPEAVQLVLQAGALGNGGEVFVLDMGEAVKIVDLATDLIELCGLEVGRDIELKFTGMRPGEKLYEEMFFHEENATQTDHPKVLRAKKAGIPDGLMKLIDRLIASATMVESGELREMLIALVPDFQRQPGDAADLPSAEDLLSRRKSGQFRVVNAPPVTIADGGANSDA